MPNMLRTPTGWPFSTVARAERAALCDLLGELGPDAPTLCIGWATADMAAHLVVRDRRPDAGPGLVIGPLHRWTERVERARRDSTPYAELVQLVRTGPPYPMRLHVLDEATNAAEYFIHNEDVRRPNDRAPRSPDANRDAALWRQLRLGGARGLSKRAGVPVLIERPDGERIGHEADDGIRVRGTVDELFLLSARPYVAVVVMDGPEAAVARLQQSLGRSA